jgi:hypothetical protein
MSSVLDSLFHSTTNCKENGHDCKSSNSSVSKIYKPDDGIIDITLKQKLFPTYGRLEQPMLCDCVIEFNDGKYGQVEIKCGKVTSSLVKDVVKKLNNCLKVVKSKKIKISKHLLIYKKFDEQQTRKLFTLTKNKIEGKPIILKEYKNKAIEI